MNDSLKKEKKKKSNHHHLCLSLSVSLSLSLACFEYPPKWCILLQCCLVVAWLVPRETAAISARSVDTIHPLYSQPHSIPYVCYAAHACLAVTCHLHFRVTDRDLLRATGYRNERKATLTLEKKILPLGLERGTFRSRVGCPNH